MNLPLDFQNFFYHFPALGRQLIQLNFYIKGTKFYKCNVLVLVLLSPKKELD